MTLQPEYEIAHLLEVVDRDDELARRVAGSFVAMGNSLPRPLDLALEARQSGAVIGLADEIKGMSAMIGVWRLGAAAAVAEEHPSPASPADELHREWQQVSRCLNQLLASGGQR